MSQKVWRVVGVAFDHMHMGDLLRQVFDHPNAEIVGVCDENIPIRMQWAVENVGVQPAQCYTNLDQCLTETNPDIVILCSTTRMHGAYVEKIAPYGVDILVEKPFAGSLADADRMIEAMKKSGKTMIINWPLAWYPPHITTKRLIEEGTIGEVREVHYYDGNRGPLRHIADKVEITPEEANRQKSEAWWYQKIHSGGSLQDYLGYGVTLGTWFHGGKSPQEVTCMVDAQRGLEVDEHSITIARYPSGCLSKFETRWGTYTDPWTHQPQPKCGFVVMGSEGTIASYDYENTVQVQTKDCPEGKSVPVDVLEEGYRSPIEHFILHLETHCPLHGPLHPILCRIGQQIVDSAVQSYEEKRTVPLIKFYDL
jgi:predicted dehydrogenase